MHHNFLRLYLLHKYSYKIIFLVSTSFSCFFSFYPRGWGREVTGRGQALNTQASDLGCLLSSPTCAFCDTTYSLSKPEVLYPSFRYFAESGRTWIWRQICPTPKSKACYRCCMYRVRSGRWWPTGTVIRVTVYIRRLLYISYLITSSASSLELSCLCVALLWMEGLHCPECLPESDHHTLRLRSSLTQEVRTISLSQCQREPEY